MTFPDLFYTAFRFTKMIGCNREVECPGCGRTMVFTNQGEIEVNCESRDNVKVPGLFVITKKCNNPFCKWNGAIEEEINWRVL